jgi:hypothetical protein
VALGEAEVRERLDLRVDVVGDGSHQTVARHAVVELLAHRLDALDAALGAHRPAQHVGILAGEVADGHAHLHQLLLEHRDPEGALQHRDELRCAYVGSSSPSLRRTYGCTAPPWMGPGRISAISITRS